MYCDAEGVAFDWLTGNLYWTDKDRHTIEVMNPKTMNRRVLIQLEESSQPRIITLDPHRRYEARASDYWLGLGLGLG